jgi:hypothetical protein
VDFAGGGGFDTASYEFADAGVQMVKGHLLQRRALGPRQRPDRRRRGEADRLALRGHGPRRLLAVEHLDGRAGDDTLTGNGGNDVFVAEAAADGADRMSAATASTGSTTPGAPVRLRRTCPTAAARRRSRGARRTAPDRVRRGGAAGDTLRAHPDGTAAVTLIGNGGGDTITGARGGDLLNGSAGRDTITGDAGNDVIQARDGEQDTVGCGTETDTALVDNGLDLFGGCERFDSVGVLGLTPKAAQVRAGRAAVLKLSWRHPESWRQLRNVTLKLGDDGVRSRPGGCPGARRQAQRPRWRPAGGRRQPGCDQGQDRPREAGDQARPVAGRTSPRR